MIVFFADQQLNGFGTRTAAFSELTKAQRVKMLDIVSGYMYMSEFE